MFSFPKILDAVSARNFARRVASLPSSSSLPSGTLLPYGGSSAPTDFLLCDGTAVSRTTYANLFAAIGTAFGAGNGTTTFNVPDARANVLAGYKSGDTNFGTLGAAVGSATKTIAAGNMPSTVVQNIGGGVQLQTTGSGFIVNTTAGGTPLSVVQASLTVTYIIKT